MAPCLSPNAPSRSLFRLSPPLLPLSPPSPSGSVWELGVGRDFHFSLARARQMLYSSGERQRGK